MLKERHLSSTNHLSTLIATEQHIKKIWNVREPAFVVFDGLFF
jgi:hypothetical protein